MEENNKKNLQKECQRILDNVPLNITNDQKMRYLYCELGKVLSKNIEFFYGNDEERKKQIYENYLTINDDLEVICKSAVFLYADMAKQMGLSCEPLEMNQDEEVNFTHWGLIYYGDGNKRYLMNPIPDFYRVQLGFFTKCFCCYEHYLSYNESSFDVMSQEYIKDLDHSLGYIKKGSLYEYTDDLLEQLRTEMRYGLAKHLVCTSDTYQTYYLTMLHLIQDNKLSVEEKMANMKKIDPEFEKHKDVIYHSLSHGLIDTEMKKAIYDSSIKSLKDKANVEKQREGSKYIGTIDITNFPKYKNEKLIYKYNYMLECIPQLTHDLTGFIENKNYMDEIREYIFQRGERDKVHRHTIYSEKDGEHNYYMMFSLSVGKDKIYSFYDPMTKECVRNIEPLAFMEQRNLKPLTNSSLNDIFYNQIKQSDLLEPVVLEDFICKGK